MSYYVDASLMSTPADVSNGNISLVARSVQGRVDCDHDGRLCQSSLPSLDLGFTADLTAGTKLRRLQLQVRGTENAGAASTGPSVLICSHVGSERSTIGCVARSVRPMPAPAVQCARVEP